MMREVTHEDAMKWLRLMKEIAYKQEERDLIEYIQEMLWQYNDLRNS
jgi:hypothetical protein